MENQSNVTREEMVINDIMRKYGEVIKIKETPYLIIEIIRNYRDLVLNDDGGLPGGVPTPPPPPPQPSPGPTEIGYINHSDLLKEILRVNKEISVTKEVVVMIKELLLRENR